MILLLLNNNLASRLLNDNRFLLVLAVEPWEGIRHDWNGDVEDILVRLGGESGVAGRALLGEFAGVAGAGWRGAQRALLEAGREEARALLALERGGPILLDD